MTRRPLLAALLLASLPIVALAGAIPPPPAIVAMWEGRDAASVRAALRHHAADGEAPGASATKRLEGGEAAWWLGLQDARAGRMDSALVQWRRAMRLRGDFDEGNALMEELWRRGGDANLAEAQALAATFAEQSRVGMPRRAPEAHARWAWALHRRGRTDSAIALVREWCVDVQARPRWTRRLAEIQLAAGDTAAAWRWLAALSARTRGQLPATEALLERAQRALHYSDERRQLTVAVVRDPIEAGERSFAASLHARFETLRAPDGFPVRVLFVPAATGVPRRAPLLFVLSPADTLPAADSLATAFAAAGRAVVLLAPRGAFGSVAGDVTGPEAWEGREAAWFAAVAADADRVMTAFTKRGEAPGGAWVIGASGDLAPAALALLGRRRPVQALLLAAPHLPLVEVAAFRARLREVRTRVFVQVAPEEQGALETADLLARDTAPGQVRVVDSGEPGRGAAVFHGDRTMARLLAWLDEEPTRR